MGDWKLTLKDFHNFASDCTADSLSLLGIWVWCIGLVNVLMRTLHQTGWSEAEIYAN